MKFNGLSKDNVDKAETMEEKKKIISNAGMELNDDELSTVVGGIGFGEESILRNPQNIIQ